MTNILLQLSNFDNCLNKIFVYSYSVGVASNESTNQQNITKANKYNL